MSSSITISATPCASATELALRHVVTQALLVQERHGAIQDRIEIEVPAWDELGGRFVFDLRGRPGAPLEVQIRDYAAELLSDEERSLWFAAIAGRLPDKRTPVGEAVKDGELRELLAGVLAETRRASA